MKPRKARTQCILLSPHLWLQRGKSNVKSKIEGTRSNQYGATRRDYFGSIHNRLLQTDPLRGLLNSNPVREMKKALFVAITAGFLSCQTQPDLTKNESGEVSLTVSGTAPGQLICTIENRGTNPWRFMTNDGVLFPSVNYWNRKEWVNADGPFCGNGFGEDWLDPNEVVVFEVMAHFSRPQIGVILWSEIDGKGVNHRLRVEPRHQKDDSEYFCAYSGPLESLGLLGEENIESP